VAPTQSEAQEKYDFLQSLIQKPVGIAILEHTIGVKGLNTLALDGPVPEMADTNGPLSRQRLLLEQARRDKLTFWELCLANAGPAPAQRAWWRLIGVGRPRLPRSRSGTGRGAAARGPRDRRSP
jgi:hypothetical protein